MSSLYFINGDATQPIIDDSETHVMICHICNDLGRWGAGFTAALDAKWDEPRKKYIELVSKFDSLNEDVMGATIPAKVEDNITVMNMVAQEGVRGPNNPTPIDYGALQVALSLVSHNIRFYNTDVTSVHMPKIGCNLAGGKWEKIEPLIQKQLVKNANVNVFVYEL